jgi:hypothetical protein
MARSRMLLINTIMSVAVIRSESSLAGEKKVGLVKSLRRPIPLRTAPDHCFELRSRAGRI